jgi:hypothetical protein
MGRGRSEKSIALVDTAYEILEEIQPASVRAVCYQLFIRGLIDDMSKASTNRVSSLLTSAREEHEIPWEWIVQEGRAIESISTWDNPASYARSVQASYRLNKWAGQPKRVIVVSEKGTVRGTLAPVLGEFEVDFLAVGGYAGASRVREVAQQATKERPLLLLYLGDHDPSGRGMSDDDLPRRLLRYAPGSSASKEWERKLRKYSTDAITAHSAEHYGIELRRIALSIEDTQALGRDLAFAASLKEADSRYAWFTEEYGAWCWELDALNPNVLRDRVHGAVRGELDLVQWERYVAAEEVERASITAALESWKSISGLAHE